MADLFIIMPLDSLWNIRPQQQLYRRSSSKHTAMMTVHDNGKCWVKLHGLWPYFNNIEPNIKRLVKKQEKKKRCDLQLRENNYIYLKKKLRYDYLLEILL